MKRTFMCGLAAIVGLVTMAGAAMAQNAEVDVLMLDLQPDVGIYELSLMPDGADLLMGADVNVLSEGMSGSAIASVQAASVTEPLATRGTASSTMVDDAMRLWRARTVDAFTVSPDLLI